MTALMHGGRYLPRFDHVASENYSPIPTQHRQPARATSPAPTAPTQPRRSQAEALHELNQRVVAEFDQAVQAKINTGLSQAAAHAAVCRENPQLRDQYVIADNQLNGRRSRIPHQTRIQQTPVVADRTTVIANPIGDFESKVGQLVSQGVPRHLATQRVCRENPALREQYVSASRSPVRER